MLLRLPLPGKLEVEESKNLKKYVNLRLSLAVSDKLSICSQGVCFHEQSTGMQPFSQVVVVPDK